MKNILFFQCLILLSFNCYNLSAQNEESNDHYSGYELNNENTPCVSSELYKTIETNCNKNVRTYLRNNNILSNAVQLDWPLRAGTGLTDCSYYFISAHVDQDTNAGTFSDYNCGTITYDGHKGTDIAISPFPFHKMDSNQVEVIAAAAGTIVDKHDGEFDKNCVGVGSGLTPNYIVIQHSDGTRALYLHMKKNSLTAKTIGQSVSVGEFLGIVGSSGSSSGPHLHFEVWAGSTSSTYQDPFSGSCNHLNANTWWLVQKPYTESSVMKASVHTTDVVIPSCPGTETLNESTIYTIPFQGSGLPAGYAKFYIFLRNETNGTAVNMGILNPDSSVYLSWTHNCTVTVNYSYWGYSKQLPTQPGIYTFEATYNGITCSQNFQVISSTEIPVINSVSNTVIYPNPVYNSCIIKFNTLLNNASMKIYNDVGKLVKIIAGINDQEFKLDREQLPVGIYFISIVENANIIQQLKLEVID